MSLLKIRVIPSSADIAVVWFLSEMNMNCFVIGITSTYQNNPEGSSTLNILLGGEGCVDDSLIHKSPNSNSTSHLDPKEREWNMLNICIVHSSKSSLKDENLISEILLSKTSACVFS